MSVLRGRIYNRKNKRLGQRTDLTSAQNEPRLTTAEQVARETGVSAATIKRDGGGPAGQYAAGAAYRFGT